MLMAALRGEPMGVVKCITSNLRVPADAQFILEGYIDERGHVESEGALRRGAGAITAA